MERYAFFRQLGKAVYGIDAAYGVFSKNAQIKPNMLWLLSALNDGEGHTQKQICWDWGLWHRVLFQPEQQLPFQPVPGTGAEHPGGI